MKKIAFVLTVMFAAALLLASPTLMAQNKKKKLEKAPAPWSKTKKGLTFDTSKYEAKSYELKTGGELVVLSSKDGKGKEAEPEKKVGLGCTGCESCGADIDVGAGTVECRSLGCTPCEKTLIVGSDLDEEMKKVSR